MINKIVVLFLILCISAVPAMAHEEDEEPTEVNELFQDDNIWIAISPIETHPLYIDRPTAIIPLIQDYPIRVAVYSNPYYYSTINSDGTASIVKVYDEDAEDFSLSELANYMNEDKERFTLTLRLPDANNPSKPGDTGAVFSNVHTESDYKYQFVFYVKDLPDIDSNVERLFLVAEKTRLDGKKVIVYQGSGAVTVTAASKKGGGNSPRK
ncbi:hypothetical protein RE476_05495 [Methanolobus mangrovi]|uniref:Uncharacterized protein n=1 Tax=Methanolobus mangrovi TaxID=3072977 RepID=A0AA51YK54_9EURY|nr:hypothetical protein [Methanolobus mangrovi]WMW23283.1 hypothetical protein RE476_05495 [Methanolobus mangrovi]